MKKIFAILLSLALMLSLAVPAMADNSTTYDITVAGTDNHTYEIYQIFTGDYHDGVLSNLVWGANGTGTLNTPVDSDILSELEGVTNSNSDAAKLAVIAKYVDLTSDHETVDKTAVKSVVPGYYLLKDVDDSLDGEDDAYTTFLVKIVGDVDVARKVAKPTVDKQVWDEDTDDDDHKDGDENWGETADHNMNETFQFKLIATLPADADFDAYKTYKVIFNDTMSTGITFEKIVSVTVDGVPLGTDGYDCSAVADQAGGDWTLEIEDIKAIKGVNLADGATVEVIYEAHLNESAAVGNVPTNTNKVYLEYSNNPNVSGEGEDEELGETEDDTVWVFTYEVNGTKVDGEDTTKKLSGAEFVLYRTVNKTVEGETVTETQYVVLDGGKVTGWTTEKPETGNIVSGNDGIIKITGLDHGTYYLEETKAPNGYNLLNKAVEVVINAVHNETDTAASTTVTGTGAANIEVINNAGTTLPETGGMGTTIFYAVGGVMVAAAAILLITKKRMSAEG